MNNKPIVTVRSVDSFAENLNQLESLIRNRAYERFVERGQQDGQDQDDWFNASSDVLQQPLMSLSETESQTLIILSLQGLDISDIEVLASHDGLLIQGDASRRTIFRHIQLARRIEPESVRAEFLSGTLRCTATILEALHLVHAKTA